MIKAIAINGSPNKDKGDTAMLLNPFIEGLTEAGAQVDLFYTSRMKIKPCTCGTMYCWYGKPGECCLQDEMQTLYPQLRAADLLILATPVYIPLPGGMQNFINRLCPFIKPLLTFSQGRTRANLHPDVKLRSFVLVSTGGWWEIENFGTVVRIVEELAADANVEYGGAVLRPHAFLMRENGRLTADGEEVLALTRKAGRELGSRGRMGPETLERISQPLIEEADLRHRYNLMV